MDDAPPLVNTSKHVRFADKSAVYNKELSNIGPSYDYRDPDCGESDFTFITPFPYNDIRPSSFLADCLSPERLSPVLDTSPTQLSYAPSWGDFGTVYKGTYKDQVVAVKNVKKFAGTSSSSSYLHQEIEILRGLSHPNILPCYYEFKAELGEMAPGVEKWRVDNHLRRNPEANRMEILQSIAAGLNYLHDKNIVHGDLRAANVLISDDGVAQLSDFGLSKDASSLEINGTAEEMGQIRYMAPELVLYQERATQASDVWSFASTCYEILTNVLPFASALSTSDIILALYNGELPYEGIQPLVNGHLNGVAIWGLMVASWIKDPGLRPTMQTILLNLQKHLKAFEGKRAHL